MGAEPERHRRPLRPAQGRWNPSAYAPPWQVGNLPHAYNKFGGIHCMVVESIPHALAHTDEDEFNPLLSAQARFDEAAERLGIDEGMQKVLRSPAREVIVHIPVMLDDGPLEVFTGYRGQHSTPRAPAKAGTRPPPDLPLHHSRPLPPRRP